MERGHCSRETAWLVGAGAEGVGDGSNGGSPPDTELPLAGTKLPWALRQQRQVWDWHHKQVIDGLRQTCWSHKCDVCTS